MTEIMEACPRKEGSTGESGRKGVRNWWRFLVDFVGHDKDFDPGKPMTDFEQVAYRYK